MSQLAKYHTSAIGLHCPLCKEELQYLPLKPGDRNTYRHREKQLL